MDSSKLMQPLYTSRPKSNFVGRQYMRYAKPLVLSCFCALAIGCTADAPEPGVAPKVNAEAPAVVAEVAPKPAPAKKVEPVALAPGDELRGEITAAKAGKLVAIDVKIGTYINRSDGELSVRLCQAANCATGTSSVVGAADNKGLEIQLSPALSIKAKQPLTWTITRSAGSNSVVVWTYPRGKSKGIVLPDGSSADRVPRINLHFAQ